MKTLLMFLAAGLVSLATVFGETTPLPELAPSRQNYEAAIAKIHADREQRLAAVNRTYADRLKQLADKLDPTEDSSQVKAVQEEVARVAGGRDTTAAERHAMTGLLLIQRVSYEKERSMQTMADDEAERKTTAAWAGALKQWHDYFLKINQAPKAALVQTELDGLPKGLPGEATSPADGKTTPGKTASFFGTPVIPGKPAAEPAPAPAPLVTASPAHDLDLQQLVNRIKLTDSTHTAEAKDVLLGAATHTPELFRSVQELELIRVHDIAAPPMNHNSGDVEKADGAYADNVVISSGGGIVIWGPYEQLEAGSYLVVYRVRFLEPMKGEACFLDVAQKTVTATGVHLKTAEVPLGRWHEIAVPVQVDEPKKFEYRVWCRKHAMAMDRIYIYRVKSGS